MCQMADDVASYLASPSYARAQQLLQVIGEDNFAGSLLFRDLGEYYSLPCVELAELKHANALFAESDRLLEEFGSRTDLDRVVIIVDSYCVRIAEQDAPVGDTDSGWNIQVTGTAGFRVSDVVEKYCAVSHLITEATTVPWDLVLSTHSQASAESAGL